MRSLVLLVIELVFGVLLDVKHHLIVRQGKAVDRAVLVEAAGHAAARVQLGWRVEAVVVLIASVAIGILVKVVKVSNVHSTLLALAGPVAAAVEGTADSANRASVPLIHLRVPPGDATVLDSLALRARLR